MGFVLIGRRVGNFTITGALGRGGMAVVYAAEHTTLPTRAAVKVLIDDFARDQDYVRRFLDEAHVAASLDDPNVVKVFDAGVLDDGRPYLVMELIEGTTLQEMTERETISVVRVVRILLQLARGVAAVHGLGFVHRDVKPENVALRHTQSGEHVKLLDFGLARPEQRDRPITAAGIVMGTPEFMSPEQALGLPVDVRSDIYSLGCVAFQLLTGRTPFEAEDGPRVLTEHVHAPVPDLLELRPGIAPRLSALVQSCLAKLPSQRPQSMDAVITELLSVEAELHSSLAEVTLPPIEPGPVSNSSPPPAVVPRPTLVARPARAPSVAAGVLCGVLLGALAAGTFLHLRAGKTRNASVSSGSAAAAPYASDRLDDPSAAVLPPAFTMAPSIDVEAEIQGGPPADSPLSRSRGAELFRARCATCHGVAGAGRGPKGSPTDLLDGAWDPMLVRRGDDDLRHVFRTVTCGSGRSMAPHATLPAIDRWAIARHVIALRSTTPTQPASQK